MIRGLILTLLLGATLASVPAYACNTYTGGAVNLGNANSLTLRTVPQQASAGAGLSCPGALQALAGAYIRVTLQNAGSLVLQDGQGNQIPFQVYQDAGYSQALVSGQPQQLSAINLLALGGSSTAIGLFFRTDPGPNVPAGTYTATVTLRWDWAICTVGALNACAWNRSPGLTQNCVVVCGAPTNWGTGSLATVTITLVVSKACRIDTLPNVDFGANAMISQFSAQQRTFSVTCTHTEGYTLSFDNGQNYLAPWRRLNNGAGQFIRYNLYYSSSSLIWNVASPLTASGTGNSQSFNYQAILDPTQSNAPVGVYTDNVLLIISY